MIFRTKLLIGCLLTVLHVANVNSQDQQQAIEKTFDSKKPTLKKTTIIYDLGSIVDRIKDHYPPGTFANTQIEQRLLMHFRSFVAKDSKENVVLMENQRILVWAVDDDHFDLRNAYHKLENIELGKLFRTTVFLISTDTVLGSNIVAMTRMNKANQNNEPSIAIAVDAAHVKRLGEMLADLDPESTVHGCDKLFIETVNAKQHSTLIDEAYIGLVDGKWTTNAMLVEKGIKLSVSPSHNDDRAGIEIDLKVNEEGVALNDHLPAKQNGVRVRSLSTGAYIRPDQVAIFALPHGKNSSQCTLAIVGYLKLPLAESDKKKAEPPMEFLEQQLHQSSATVNQLD